MGDQRVKQWHRMVEAVWFWGHPGQFTVLCVWGGGGVGGAPGDGKKTTIPRRTHKIHLPSPLKKRNTVHKFNWLIKTGLLC